METIIKHKKRKFLSTKEYKRYLNVKSKIDCIGTALCLYIPLFPHKIYFSYDHFREEFKHSSTYTINGSNCRICTYYSFNITNFKILEVELNQSKFFALLLDGDNHSKKCKDIDDFYKDLITTVESIAQVGKFKEVTLVNIDKILLGKISYLISSGWKLKYRINDNTAWYKYY